MLGPALFYLGWWDSFLTILFFNMIGTIPPAYMATFGPKMGLRAMTIPRFAYHAEDTDKQIQFRVVWCDSSCWRKCCRLHGMVRINLECLLHQVHGQLNCGWPGH